MHNPGRKPDKLDRQKGGRAPKHRVTNEQIAKALTKSRGIIVYAAQMLNVSRQTVYSRMSRSLELKALANEIVERNLDFTERQLFSAIHKGNVTAMIFYLKCKGKHRGYVERQEIDQTITDLTPVNPPDIILEFVDCPALNGIPDPPRTDDTKPAIAGATGAVN